MSPGAEGRVEERGDASWHASRNARGASWDASRNAGTHPGTHRGNFTGHKGFHDLTLKAEIGEKMEDPRYAEAKFVSKL